MALFLSIFISVILAYILLMMGPLIGGIFAFGIIAGCLFRGLYLLNDLHKRMVPKKDKVKEAYENYVKERDYD